MGHTVTASCGEASYMVEFLVRVSKHTHTHHFMALWILSRTTWVIQYQKKHSPTHSYRGHQAPVYSGWPLAWKSGKTGNVREFETCQGNVRDFVNSQGIVREGKKSCQGKVSQKCSLLVEYLRSYGYFVASTVISSFVIIMKYFGTW